MFYSIDMTCLLIFISMLDISWECFYVLVLDGLPTFKLNYISWKKYISVFGHVWTNEWEQTLHGLSQNIPDCAANILLTLSHPLKIPFQQWTRCMIYKSGETLKRCFPNQRIMLLFWWRARFVTKRIWTYILIILLSFFIGLF